MANAGGSCPAFASRAGITTSQLYAWNNVLGNNGQNCASSFWGNTYYCVGVRSSKIKRNAVAEITGYAPPAYGATSSAAEPTLYSKTVSSSDLSVSTLEPYVSASEPVAIPSTYPAVPSSYSILAASNTSSIVMPSSSHYDTATTHSSSLPANATLSSISTAYTTPAQYPTSAGTGHATSEHDGDSNRQRLQTHLHHLKDPRVHRRRQPHRLHRRPGRSYCRNGSLPHVK